MSEPAGEQTLYRLRCREQGVLLGRELDLLSPFEKLEPLQKPLQPERAARLDHWRVYHQAFLLEQAGKMVVPTAAPTPTPTPSTK